MEEDYRQLLAERQQLKEEYQELKADYEQLAMMFDNMGQGYEEALELYDKAMEASRMKSAFIQQISHEIRTPLNILGGFTQVLTMPGMELDEATKQEVSQGIAENTKRITSLVNKMIELSEANSEMPIELSDDVLGLQIAAQAADESGITTADHLAFDMRLGEGADEVMLHTNERQATRALSLLLDNARKFTRPPEASLAYTKQQKQGEVVLDVEMRDGMLLFIVEDNGIGVPARESERIFEEFVQLDEYYDGTGIGLTVARSIARRMGGDVRLDTSYEGGARFVLSLPTNC